MKSKYELTLKDCQNAQLRILKYIVEICKRNNWTYWVMYGTLLGAIRHGGFIPWDDDIDIAMPRKDYEQFVKYFRSNKTKPYILHNKQLTPNCFYNISRVCDNRYIVYFDDFKYTSGVFVDVYPYDGLGDGFSKAEWFAWDKRNRFIKKGVNLSCSKSLLYGKNTMNRLLNFPFLLYSKLRGNQYFLSKLDNFPKGNLVSDKYAGCPCWTTKMLTNNFNDFVEVMFEDTVVLVPKNYDEVLKELYGDYMKLPPEDQRIPHHNYRAYKL